MWPETSYKPRTGVGVPGQLGHIDATIGHNHAHNLGHDLGHE